VQQVTTNDKHSNPSPSKPTLDLAQARRCGAAALRCRHNPDPAVIDGEYATAIALEQAWKLGGELCGPEMTAKWHLNTATAIRDLCEHGPAGLTGLSKHYEYSRKCAKAAEKLRIAQNLGCPKVGVEPSRAEVIEYVNAHRGKHRASRVGDWQKTYTSPLSGDPQNQERDFTDEICDQDEARQTLSDLAEHLSPLAQQALTLGVELGGELPNARELAEYAGVSISTARRAILLIQGLRTNLATPAPLTK